MDSKELLKKVRQIEIKSRRLSDNLFGGEYLSTFKGRGMTFSEVRKYEFGDDIRSIDWNVTARYNEPFIKVFEEERELTLMLLIDVSGSKNFATRNKLKKEIVTEIAATLAFSALKNNDKVGAILFTDTVELFIPPNKGKRHILRIIRELLEFKPKSSKTSIDSSLKFLLSVIQKKAIVFVLNSRSSLIILKTCLLPLLGGINNSTVSVNSIAPTLSLFFKAENASVAAISVTISFFNLFLVAKFFEPLTSISNISVNSLSSSKTFIKGSLYLAVTFQSIDLISSPNPNLPAGILIAK